MNTRAVTWVFTALVLTCSGCRGIQSSLDPSGEQARQISQLWWQFFYILTTI